MKIALVSPYDFSYPGGVNNHIAALDRQFLQMGHEVRVISPASRTVHHFGNRFIPIGKPRPIPVSGSIIRVPISLHLAPRIKEVLAKEGFDIIHLHEPFMPMLCSAVLRFSHTVNIGTFHAHNGKPGYKFGRPISTYILKRRMLKLHGRIAVSKPAMDYHCQFVPGEYQIIPNGIDLEHFSPKVTPIEKYQDDKLNILFVGRLEKRKGLNYLLAAYQRVKNEIKDCRLIIVGPGTRLRKKYEKIVEENDLKDVNFVGRVSYDELPRYYLTADVFCSPATGYESFGIVLLEAMAMGRPIVATSIDGYAEVVNHGKEGLLTPPKDKAALAEALITMLHDPELRHNMGQQGQIEVQKYSWRNVAKQIFNYYLRVIG